MPVMPLFCSQLPAPLFALAGWETVDLTPPEDVAVASDHLCVLHDNVCSYVKYLVERLQENEGGFPLTVVPNSCDAMKKLHDVLRFSFGPERLFLLDVPRNDGEAAVAYLAAQYRDLLTRLGCTQGRFPALASPGRGAEPPPAAAGTGRLPGGEQKLIPVGVAGSVYPENRIRSILAGGGAEAIFLHRCGQAPPMAPLPMPGPTFSVAQYCLSLAEAYLRANRCPRMVGGQFGHTLVAAVKEKGLVALVLSVLKFCDVYHLAIEALRERLPAGFPVLVLEGDLASGFGEQSATRLEALLEHLTASGHTPPPPREFGVALYAGVDVGSTQVKAVLLDGRRNVRATTLRPTTGLMTASAEAALQELLAKAAVDRSRVTAVGVTGYGRKSLASDASLTEITCHARGVYRFRPQALTVIDVGGQDSKVIVLDAQGHVLRFAMNDKCAAGTGRFIESIVRKLEIGYPEFNRLSLEAGSETRITSVCSVFAESEVISLTSRGEALAGIARGVNAAIARRIAGLVRKVEGAAPYVLTGGVSANAGFVRELERELGAEVGVLEHSLHAGAIGAAILAAEA